MCLLLAFVVGALSSLGTAQNTAPSPAHSENERSLATVLRDRIPMDKLTPEEREKVQKELDEFEKLLAIAVSPDTPPVGLRGRVLLPDGSPAAGYYVQVTNPIIFLREFTEEQKQQLPVPLKRFPEMEERVSGVFTNPDGTFVINPLFNRNPSEKALLPGTNAVVTVFDTDGQARGADERKRFMSKPIVFVVSKDMEPLEITLEEGIPVRGKMVQDNGTPAVNRALSFQQAVKPILGADLPAMQQFKFNTTIQRGADRTNATGEYEAFLLPGDYTVTGMRVLSERTLTIAETDKEKRFDFTVAGQVMVEAVLPDGSPAKGLKYRFASEHPKQSFSGSGANNYVRIQASPCEGSLFVVRDNSWHGIIAPITPEMTGNHRITLQPLGIVCVTFVDAEGKPVAGTRASLTLLHHGKTGYDAWARTDSEGKAEWRMPPGKATAQIRADGVPLKDAFERDVVIEPDGTVDLGTVRYAPVWGVPREPATAPPQ